MDCNERPPTITIEHIDDEDSKFRIFNDWNGCVQQESPLPKAKSSNSLVDCAKFADRPNNLSLSKSESDLKVVDQELYPWITNMSKLTVDDYHNRYSLNVSPFVTPCASPNPSPRISPCSTPNGEKSGSPTTSPIQMRKS